MTTIPQKELRNNVGDVLRRAEGGEEFTVTVSGRPVAHLGPARDRTWVETEALADIWSAPTDPTLARDLKAFGAPLRDPWGR